MLDADPYPPLATLKPLAEGVWIADGPVIRMKYVLGSALPFPTRMTVVRLDDGGLWLHSPTAPDPALRAEIDALGPVRALVAPNRLHWWWLGDWQADHPDATVYAAPRVAEAVEAGAGFGEGEGPERPPRIDRILGDAPEWPELDQILIESRLMTEAVFHHRASRTLILTDLVENFEPDKVHGWLGRQLMRLGGVMDPNGSTPRDLRLTYTRAQRETLRAAAERMIAWAPERVILAHGRIYDHDATAELRRALAWTGAS